MRANLLTIIFTPLIWCRVQLLKVLETRKTMLQKEQGMAFARAMAAGFDIDNLSPLMSFSDCFGASRLRYKLNFLLINSFQGCVISLSLSLSVIFLISLM